jgi:protein-S-isoprenylcysteine O-methyltransferase Ste14
MKRLGMAVASGFIAAAGLVVVAIDGPAAGRLAVIGASILWCALERHIGLGRAFEGRTPSHWLVTSSRLLWLPGVVLSWADGLVAWTGFDVPSWLFCCSLGVFLLFLALRLWAVLTLGASFSYDVKRPPALVVKGPYRWIRHPSYLAICVLGSLPGLMLGSVAGLVVMTLTTVPQTVLRTALEDRMLEREMGEEFRRHARISWRLVPYVY